MSWKLNLELYHENHEIVSPLVYLYILYIFSLYTVHMYIVLKN